MQTHGVSSVEAMDQTFMKALRKKFMKKRRDPPLEKQGSDYRRLHAEPVVKENSFGKMEEQLIRIQKKLGSEGERCTYFAEVNPNLEIKIESLEADCREGRESRLRADLVRLNAELMDQRHCTAKAGEELSRLKNRLAAEEESCTYFAKINSEFEIKVEQLETNFRKEKENSFQQGEDLIRLRSNLSAETESCAYFMKVIKDLETKIEELRPALLTAQNELKDEKEKFFCQICLERPRNALCLPCRHFQYCMTCLGSHQRVSKTCPTCRVSTENVLECYT